MLSAFCLGLYNSGLSLDKFCEMVVFLHWLREKKRFCGDEASSCKAERNSLLIGFCVIETIVKCRTFEIKQIGFRSSNVGKSILSERFRTHERHVSTAETSKTRNLYIFLMRNLLTVVFLIIQIKIASQAAEFNGKHGKNEYFHLHLVIRVFLQVLSAYGTLAMSSLIGIGET